MRRDFWVVESIEEQELATFNGLYDAGRPCRNLCFVSINLVLGTIYF